MSSHAGEILAVMADYAALDRLMSRQHGLVASRQLAGVGVGRSQAESWVRRGQLVAVRRGVYRTCGAVQSWRMAAAAAVLAAGEGAVLSHRSAGRLWGLLSDRSDAELEITAARQRRLAGVSAHRHALAPTETTVVDGIPVTTVERTLLDLAERVDSRRLGEMVDDALRRRLTTTTRLAAVLGRRARPGRRKWRPMRRVLADRGQGYDPGANDWERRMDRLWDRLGLPPALRQHRVRVRGRTYVLDRAIVGLRIGVEWNGRAYHGTRSGFEYDCTRRSDLLQDGWLILDFTPASSPERIEQTVRAACEERERLLLLSA